MNYLFREPEEKGFIEIYPEPKPDWTIKDILFLILMLALVAFWFWYVNNTLWL